MIMDDRTVIWVLVAPTVREPAAGGGDALTMRLAVLDGWDLADVALSGAWDLLAAFDATRSRLARLPS